jgi:hypothetical protein
MSRGNITNLAAPSKSHAQLELVDQQVKSESNTIGTVILQHYLALDTTFRGWRTYSKTPNSDSADKDKVCTECNGLENIRATSKSSIDSNARLALGYRCNLTKDVDCCRSSIQLSTSVVGDDDTINTLLNGNLGV